MEDDMPPKVKITRENIICTALEIVKREGAGALNARSLAAELGCSTQPVFSNFSSMEELDTEVLKAAYQIYLGFIEAEVNRGEHPPYKAYGRAYIRFAREERELFKLLFMCDRGGEELIPTADFDASVEMIMEANGVDRERARLIHLEVWSATHGIATMLATSFLSLDEELISRILSDVYHGVRARHCSEVSDGRN